MPQECLRSGRGAPRSSASTAQALTPRGSPGENRMVTCLSRSPCSVATEGPLSAAARAQMLRIFTQMVLPLKCEADGVQRAGGRCIKLGRV